MELTLSVIGVELLSGISFTLSKVRAVVAVGFSSGFVSQESKSFISDLWFLTWTTKFQ